MALQIEPGEEPGVLRLVGELDMSTVPVAEEAFAQIVDGPARLTADLSALDFLDSSGVRLLLKVLTDCRERGGDLVMRAPTPPVRRLFDLLELDANGVIIEPDSGGES